MNYQLIHNQIITRAKDRTATGYMEEHHIIPKSMGGTDDPTNLVMLTPEEHYLVHQLLVKLYPSNENLIFAANMMCSNRPSNKLYGWLRRRLSIKMTADNPNKNGTARREYNKKYGSPNKRFKHTIESKNKFAEMKLGDKNPRFGKPGTMRTKTYLINPDKLTVEFTFDCLEDAEKHLKANHTSVWNNRNKNTPYRGYYWCVGDNELTKLKEEKQNARI